MSRNGGLGFERPGRHGAFTMTSSGGDNWQTCPPREFFEVQAERLMDRLYGTALRLTREQADAEDLVAETFAKAWARLESLEDRQSFEKWIFRILVNTFISAQRREKARPKEVLAEEDAPPGEFSLFEKMHQPFLLWWGNPEQRLLDKLLREDIESALDTLPETFRLVIVMVEFWGFSYAEAADTLGLPVGTVRSRLSRGRSLMQHALWEQACQLGIAAGPEKGAAK
ncbi:sigma-70 family RNA polymerase sigma factor [Chelativorans sp. YIM 93263]|uniref:sigma-70 family RNA polymerase sigma factor n=1 Tax=Chelativorans sp. YIM 93263 TaxID=2906648 RepID=UPI0023794F8F|nr:sigma-70 family RNA polymerase sigma factor [Chelativorans sp. YIM 93263]